MRIADACNGIGVILSDEEGKLWMSAPLYKNDIYCEWKINVEVGKVRTAYTLQQMIIPWYGYTHTHARAHGCVCVYLYNPSTLSVSTSMST